MSSDNYKEKSSNAKMGTEMSAATTITPKAAIETLFKRHLNNLICVYDPQLLMCNLSGLGKVSCADLVGSAIALPDFVN